MKTVLYAHATHPGRKRDHNEDSYCADPENGLFIIADGMGGHAGGEVASTLVVNSVRQDISKGMRLDEALIAAHHNVLNAVKNKIGRPGMGATAVALHIMNRDYQIAWVGDSRAYLWDGRLKRLTHDHSYVQKMIDEGILTENEARSHPHRNILLQALGMEGMPDLTVGLVSGSLLPGQKILLCSDGLTGELEDEEIAFIVGPDRTGQDCVSALIQAANDQEGKDNISVILVSPRPDESQTTDDDDTLPLETNRIEELSKPKI